MLAPLSSASPDPLKRRPFSAPSPGGGSRNGADCWDSSATTRSAYLHACAINPRVWWICLVIHLIFQPLVFMLSYILVLVRWKTVDIHVLLIFSPPTFFRFASSFRRLTWTFPSNLYREYIYGVFLHAHDWSIRVPQSWIQDYNFLFLNLVKGSQNNLSSEKDDFSDLPPNQRRKRLQQKIDELNSKVDITAKSI